MKLMPQNEFDEFDDFDNFADFDDGDDFSALDCLLDFFKEYKSMDKTFILNPKRAAEMQRANDIIQRAILSVDPDAKITWHTCPLHTGAAAIEVVCDLIDIQMPKIFPAFALADDLSIDCLNTQQINFSLGFNNVFILVDCK